ncbi:MAG: hypothetical protein ACRDL3_03890, partial [Solirubrobacterales bacterium]
MRRALPLIVLAIACGLIAACGGGDDEGETDAVLPEGCEEVEEPAPSDVELEKPKRSEAPSARRAVVETS